MSKNTNDPENDLRAIWTADGISDKRQSEMLEEIKAKAQPGAQVGPFRIAEHSKAKHTPGPWTHKPRARDGHVDQIQRKGITFISVGNPYAESPILDYPHDNTQTANARLVAAAPEMLEALQAIVVLAADQGRRNLPECAGLARQAIAKATQGE